MEWFMERIEKGSFEVINPYNHHVSHVLVSPEKIHSIVFWSKNFRPFIESGYGRSLKKKGYNLFFNFTINSHLPLLEPNLPSLANRLDQLESLCSCFNSNTINWRFDPICFYKTKGSHQRDNLHDFSLIADKAANCGIKRCITSFMDHYPKIQKRTAHIPEFFFKDPPLEEKKQIVLKMAKTLSEKRISLHTCCEREVIDLLDLACGVTKSSCIPNDLLVKLFGGRLSMRKDYGQRVKSGCGCKTSIDIGSYNLHPCYHSCLFCYANPAKRTDGFKVRMPESQSSRM
jgi:DNA repair photolyase